MSSEAPTPELPRATGSPVRQWIIFALKVALLVAIFVYLLHSGRLSPRDLRGLVTGWQWSLLSLALAVPQAAVCSLRYWILLRTLGLNATFRQATSLTMIGLFFDLAAPVVNGGDVVKVYYLGRSQPRERWGLSLLSVLLDRIIGIFALFAFALIICLVGWSYLSAEPRLEQLAYILLVICAGSVLAFVVLASERLERSERRKRLLRRLPYHEHLERTYESFASLRHHHRALLMMLGLSLINHTIACASVLCLAQGVQFTTTAGAPTTLPLVPALIVLPLALFLNTFGIGGGFGAGEIAFEGLFVSVLSIKGGAKLALAFHVLGVLFRLGGVPFWLLYKRQVPGETQTKG